MIKLFLITSLSQQIIKNCPEKETQWKGSFQNYEITLPYSSIILQILCLLFLTTSFRFTILYLLLLEFSDYFQTSTSRFISVQLTSQPIILWKAIYYIPFYFTVYSFCSPNISEIFLLGFITFYNESWKNFFFLKLSHLKNYILLNKGIKSNED